MHESDPSTITPRRQIRHRIAEPPECQSPVHPPIPAGPLRSSHIDGDSLVLQRVRAWVGYVTRLCRGERTRLKPLSSSGRVLPVCASDPVIAGIDRRALRAGLPWAGLRRPDMHPLRSLMRVEAARRRWPRQQGTEGVGWSSERTPDRARRVDDAGSTGLDRPTDLDRGDDLCVLRGSSS